MTLAFVIGFSIPLAITGVVLTSNAAKRRKSQEIFEQVKRQYEHLEEVNRTIDKMDPKDIPEYFERENTIHRADLKKTENLLNEYKKDYAN